jgi:hypothetical protein
MDYFMQALRYDGTVVAEAVVPEDDRDAWAREALMSADWVAVRTSSEHGGRYWGAVVADDGGYTYRTADDPMFKAEVHTGDGEWTANALRFHTRGAANLYAHRLMMRWTLVRDWRVVEVEADPAAYEVATGLPVRTAS